MKTNIFLDKKSPIIIAVDGEAASGKGTLCKKLARDYNMFYCQTSIFYRKLAYIALSKNIESIEELASISIDKKLFMDIDESEIYTETISEKTSILAANPNIREALKSPQKEVLISNSRVVMEGRDIGTVIAPNANVKLYIIADIDKRAERRYDQYKKSGKDADFENIKKLLIERDERDKSRDSAPLKPSSESVILDSSDLGEYEFYEKTIEVITEICAKNY